MTDRPFFSVLVTTYNRGQEVERCVRSCIEQTFEDFEVVVVDDGSTDTTVEVLEALEEPLLRVVQHEANRGISPARATAVDNARGEWFIPVDSDDELFPHTLARLRAVIDTLPPGVHIIRSRLERDDGRIDPAIMPTTAVTGYQERLLWLQEVLRARVSTDAGHCMHRCVFEQTNYLVDRRGAMEGLWELNLARRERSLWIPDVLGRVHDAPDSHTRDASASRLIARLLSEAADTQWMFETMLAEHGVALERYAPYLWLGLPSGAAGEAFLAGDRRAGLRHTWESMRRDPFRWNVWLTLLLGLLGPRPLAYSKLARRQITRLTAHDSAKRRLTV